MSGTLVHCEPVAKGMTNAFSSMEYPHWLIVAGAILLMLGFVGLALRQRAAEAELGDMASDHEPSEPEAELAQTQGADRKSKLEEQQRDRWFKEPLNDRPKI
jgi:hypothetical protein